MLLACLLKEDERWCGMKPISRREVRYWDLLEAISDRVW